MLEVCESLVRTRNPAFTAAPRRVNATVISMATTAADPFRIVSCISCVPACGWLISVQEKGEDTRQLHLVCSHY